jgi:Fur family ferric uptake transcriptional regulator
MPSSSDLRSELKVAGLRVTTQRLAVLELLRERRLHLSVEQVIEATKARLLTVSVQAVYDALSALCGAGLARRIEPAGSVALFEARVADNHHHIVCRVCGTVADVDCVIGSAPCLKPSSTANGFVVDEAEVTFWGICANCQQPVSRTRTASKKESDHA